MSGSPRSARWSSRWTGGPPAARARDSITRKSRKDDRIYVFNVAANAERFEKTGEMGIGITKPGVGPERRDRRRRQRAGPAAVLLQARHLRGRSRSRPAPVQTIVWRDGKTRITHRQRLPRDVEPGAGRGSRRNCLTTTRSSPARRQGRAAAVVPHPPRQVQARGLDHATVAHLRDADELSGAERRQPRARCSRTPRSTSTSRRARALFRVHAGQFKPPYGAQEMTSSGSQMFVDRALVSNSFFRGRETGVALWGATTNNKLEWRIGAFNGNSMTRDGQRQQQAAIQRAPDVAAQRQPGAEPARLGHRRPLFGERLRVDHGADLRARRSTGRTRTTSPARPATRSEMATPFSARRHLQVSRASRRTGCIDDRQAHAGDRARRSTRPGGFIQAGQLFSRRRYEVALRYAQFDPTRPDRAEQHHEKSAARSTTTTRATG